MALIQLITLCVFFNSHLNDFSNEKIDDVMDIYNKNNQCTKRSIHEEDIKEVDEFIKSRNGGK